MKTRFAYITLSVIAALVLSSCDKTGISGSDDFGEPNLVINLGLSSSSNTRTQGAQNDTAEDYEKTINSVRIFLAQADENGVPVADAAVLEVSQDMMKLSNNNNSVSAKIFGLKGNYQLLYVAVNCPDGLNIDITTYEDFIGSYSNVSKSVLDDFWKVTYSSSDPTVVESGSFFMVNGVDSNPGTKNINGGVFVDFSSSVTATVNLERLAAKVVADQDQFIDFSTKRQKVYGDTDADTYVINSAVIDSWALMNCVNSFNLIQVYKSDTLHDHDDVIYTPSSSNTYSFPSIPNSFKCDGYYYTDPSEKASSSSLPEYNELVFVPAGSALYCLENNPDYYPGTYEKTSGKTGVPSVSDSKMMGRCTAVVFRAQLKLADGFDSDFTIDEPLGENGDQGEWQNADATGQPTKANTDITATIYSYKSKLYHSLAKLVTDNGSLAGKDNAGLRAAGVKVYENGYMYYTYYISKTDYNVTISPYYCVERNKSYRLNVTEVNSFGDDLPCDYTNYDPEDPIDRATPRINVSADVLPWDAKETQTYEIQ